jgi:hypothetical protein
MCTLYFLQPVGDDLSQYGQDGSALHCHGGDNKPLAKAILGEMLLKPLKIGGRGRLLLFVRHRPIRKKHAAFAARAGRQTTAARRGTQCANVCDRATIATVQQSLRQHSVCRYIATSASDVTTA